jgi:1-acyl-sn-glycerol-3-phosphate acyltransferase
MPAASPAPVKPPRWATSPWARTIRSAAWWWEVSRHVKHYCTPLRVEGQEHFDRTRTPAIFIPNHRSHLDSLVSYEVIPPRLRRRTAIAAASDRFYRVGWKGAKFSLLYNAFPIERGGGRKALEYAEELLDKEWALIVYPEGTRSRDGTVQPFHHGVSILALGHRVPVIPIYMHGTAAIMPVGSRRLGRPGPVTVAIGEPVWLEPGISIPEGTAILEESMRALELRFTPATELLPGGVPVGTNV